ncbi:hypothetical protein AGMMS4956_18870 [Bacteroidia bacterium]|nr:hypothetical protein AGMMS4956_18870 [Bacteroidia bacterium]
MKKNFFIGTWALLLIAMLAAGCNTSTQVKNPLKGANITNLSYGTDAQQTLDISIPSGIGAATAIVYIHGGSYISGDKAEMVSFLNDYKPKVIVASINYRLVVPSAQNNVHIDEMLADVGSALGKIKQTARENGVGVSKVILMGHSAGAHLSLLYGYKYFPQDNNSAIPIAACVSLAGPTDFTDDIGWTSGEFSLPELSGLASALTGQMVIITQNDYTQQSNYETFRAAAETISPAYYVSQSKGVPPTIMVHAEGDNTVPYSNSARLNTALNSTNIVHQLLTPTDIVGDKHSLGLHSNPPPSWIAAVQAFIETR